jgi:hypothetical protein
MEKRALVRGAGAHGRDLSVSLPGKKCASVGDHVERRS